MTTLTPAEIVTARDKCQASIFTIQFTKTKALEDNKISINQFNEISAEQAKLQNKLSELNVQLLTRVLSDITVEASSPGAKLSSSVNRLNEAIDKLEEVGKFSATAASVINALSVIIAAVSALPLL
jgi:SMC interacting uncharacterized protein involved in chromosome segregation